MKSALSSLRDAPENQQRFPQEEVGQALRINLRQFDAFERQSHVCQHRALDRLEQLAHLLANLADVRDMGETAAAELRHLGGEEEIWSAADGDGIESRAAKVMPQRREYLFFVAEVAIGQQYDVPQVTGGLRLLHDVKECRQHFRAAARLEALNVATPRRHVVGARDERLGGKLVIAVVESH